MSTQDISEWIEALALAATKADALAQVDRMHLSAHDRERIVAGVNTRFINRI